MNLAFVKKLSVVKTKEEFEALLAGSHAIYEDDSTEYVNYDLVFHNIYRFHTTESLEELAIFIANQSVIISYNALTNSFLQNKNEFQLQIFELVKNKFSNEALINMYTNKYTSDVIKEAIYVMPENPISSENILKIFIKRVSYYNDYSKDSTIEKFKLLKHILSVEDLIEFYNYYNTPEEIRNEIFSKPIDTIPCEIISSSISYYHHHSDVEKLQLFESKKHKFSKEDIYKIYGGFATPTEIKEAILLMPANVIPAEIIIKQITQYYHTIEEKLQIFEFTKHKLSNEDLIKIYKDYYTPKEIKDSILAMPVDKIPAEIVIYVLTYYSTPSNEIKLKLFESTKHKLSNEDLITIYKDYDTPQEIKDSILAMPADKIPADIIISAIRHYSTDAELKLNLFESIKDTITTEQLTFLYNDLLTPIAIRLHALDVIGLSLIKNDIMSELTGYSSNKNEIKVKIFELCRESLTEENLIALFNDYNLPTEIKVAIVDMLGEKVLSKNLIEYFIGYQSNEEFSTKLFEKVIDKLSSQDINTIFQDYSAPQAIRLHIIEKSMHVLTDLSINEAYRFSYNSLAVSSKILETAKDKLSTETLSFGSYSMHNVIQSTTWELLKDKASESIISSAISGAAQNNNIELFNTILKFTNGEIPKEARVSILFSITNHENPEFNTLLWQAIKDQLSSNDIYTAIKFHPSSRLKPILDLCKDKLVQKDIHLLLKDIVILGEIEVFNEIMDIFGYTDLPKSVKGILIETALKYNKFDFLKHLTGELPEEISTTEVTQELIAHLVDNKYISNTFIQDVAKEHLTKGNFEIPYKFAEKADIKSINHSEAITILVEAIQKGIQNSSEPNKYQAVMQLMNKAGINLTDEHQHKLKAVQDNKNPDDFKFIDGLAHKLAAHYMSLNANFSDALRNLDNDFALEVLTINGVIPKSLDNDVTVFRGMNGVTEDMIETMFEYGHRAYSIGEFQKFLGYYVSSSWNEADNPSYQLGGTYVSFSSFIASGFAYGDDGALFEIHLPKGSPKTCGAWINGMELIPSYINPEDIVAIYKLNYRTIEKVFANPNGKASPKYSVGGAFSEEPNVYNSICNPGNEKSEVITIDLYDNYEDFYAKYTEDKYASDQAQLWENFFADRGFYQEEFFARECNPDLYCC